MLFKELVSCSVSGMPRKIVYKNWSLVSNLIFHASLTASYLVRESEVFRLVRKMQRGRLELNTLGLPSPVFIALFWNTAHKDMFFNGNSSRLKKGERKKRVQSKKRGLEQRREDRKMSRKLYKRRKRESYRRKWRELYFATILRHAFATYSSGSLNAEGSSTAIRSRTVHAVRHPKKGPTNSDCILYEKWRS